MASSVAETHISVVIFSEEAAYKWYKPIKTAFLDHSTRERRREGVRREVELNRRLAPDVYLGTADLVGEDGEVLDHLTRMRRLPEERRLSALVRTPEAEREVERVARRMAVFHAGANRSPEIDAEATAAAIASRWRQNLQELEPFVDRWTSTEELSRVRQLALGYLEGREALFDLRIASGLVCDGHGDLLADDIFCLPDGPRILDCLDFDDRLRWGDVLADIAFLMMDLERLGRPDLALRLLRTYDELTAERHPPSLADHHVALRALIRAKVAFLRAEQGAEEAVSEGYARMAQALAHLESSQVRLVLVGGPPGSGKSTLANRIADEMRWVVLGSDELRKTLAGTPPGADLTSEPFAGAYTREAVDAVYGELISEAERLLAMGETVVLDASWLQADRRLAAADAAERAKTPLVEFECEAPAEACERRITARRGQPDCASDVTIEAARRLRAERDPWRTAVRVDTFRPVDDALSEMLAVLSR